MQTTTASGMSVGYHVSAAAAHRRAASIQTEDKHRREHEAKAAEHTAIASRKAGHAKMRIKRLEDAARIRGNMELAALNCGADDRAKEHGQLRNKYLAEAAQLKKDLTPLEEMDWSNDDHRERRARAFDIAADESDRAFHAAFARALAAEGLIE